MTNGGRVCFLQDMLEFAVSNEFGMAILALGQDLELSMMHPKLENSRKTPGNLFGAHLQHDFAMGPFALDPGLIVFVQRLYRGSHMFRKTGMETFNGHIMESSDVCIRFKISSGHHGLEGLLRGLHKASPRQGIAKVCIPGLSALLHGDSSL